MSMIGNRLYLISTSYMTGLIAIFILLHMRQSYVCFGELLSVRTLCVTSHK